MLRFFIAGILVIFAGYGILEGWPLLVGPALVVASPIEGTTSQGGIIDVSGRASRVALLTLDGAELLHDEAGNFSATLTFPRGASLLTFSATDRFGRRVSITRSIFVSE